MPSLRATPRSDAYRRRFEIRSTRATRRYDDSRLLSDVTNIHDLAAGQRGCMFRELRVAARL